LTVAEVEAHLTLAELWLEVENDENPPTKSPDATKKNAKPLPEEPPLYQTA
jgi:hypothetical protein